MAHARHYHTFDIHPKYPTMVACTICGFSAPAIMLKSKVNLDAWTARKHCTQAVLDLLGMNRFSDRVEEGDHA